MENGRTPSNGNIIAINDLVKRYDDVYSRYSPKQLSAKGLH